MSSVFPPSPSLSLAPEQRFAESQSASGALSFPHVSARVCVKRKKHDFSPPPPPPLKTHTLKQHTTKLRRFLFPLTRSFSRLELAFLSPFSRCDLVACVTERKQSSLLPPSWCTHSPPPIFRSPFERTARQPCSLQKTRSVPQCCHTLHWRGGGRMAQKDPYSTNPNI